MRRAEQAVGARHRGLFEFRQSLNDLLATVARYVPGGELPDDLAVVLVEHVPDAAASASIDTELGDEQLPAVTRPDA